MTNSCGARCSISVLWSAQNSYSPIICSSGWLPRGAGAGGVCAQPRHVGGESWARTWFAGGAPHFGFATPFGKFDRLVEAIFWERCTVRPVVQTIVRTVVHIDDEFFVLSFNVSVLYSILAFVFFHGVAIMVAHDAAVFQRYRIAFSRGYARRRCCWGVWNCSRSSLCLVRVSSAVSSVTACYA